MLFTLSCLYRVIWNPPVGNPSVRQASRCAVHGYTAQATCTETCSPVTTLVSRHSAPHPSPAPDRPCTLCAGCRLHRPCTGPTSTGPRPALATRARARGFEREMCNGPPVWPCSHSQSPQSSSSSAAAAGLSAAAVAAPSSPGVYDIYMCIHIYVYT